MGLTKIVVESDPCDWMDGWREGGSHVTFKYDRLEESKSLVAVKAKRDFRIP